MKLCVVEQDGRVAPDDSGGSGSGEMCWMPRLAAAVVERTARRRRRIRTPARFWWMPKVRYSAAGMDFAEPLPEGIFTFGRDSAKPIVIAMQGVAISGGRGADRQRACSRGGARNQLRPHRYSRRPLASGDPRAVAAAIGERRARELWLTGRIFTAPEALAWGWCTRSLRRSSWTTARARSPRRWRMRTRRDLRDPRILSSVSRLITERKRTFRGRARKREEACRHVALYTRADACRSHVRDAPSPPLLDSQ